MPSSVNKNTDDVNIRKPLTIIAEISTVSEIDTAAVIEAMIIKVPERIVNGEIVRLGDFGSFYVTLKSEGADSENAFSPNMIKKNFYIYCLTLILITRAGFPRTKAKSGIFLVTTLPAPTKQ